MENPDQGKRDRRRASSSHARLQAGVSPNGEKNMDVNKLDVFIENEEANEFRQQMWAGKSNILVCVRVRPLMKHDRSTLSVAKVLDHKIVIVLDPAEVRKEKDVLRANRSQEKRYAFDYVFDEKDDQVDVYKNSTRFLVPGILDGYNATVFAYGCTGAGKTYTMIGTPDSPGIMVHTLRELFAQADQSEEQNSVKYKVSISFLEVYNENIRDLLSKADEYLDLREDPMKGPMVSGITEIETKSAEQIMQLLDQGNRNRTTHATCANEVSSRSHAVLQVVVECRDRAPGTVAKLKIGKLSLVDLAGSERASVTKNAGKRLQEGANINRSLLALGNCINALVEKNGKGQYVPYRDSKLTRLLKDSLGGNCRTAMIANISQAASSFQETLNTLKYANRAKNIKTNAQRNELDVDHHIVQYVQLIQGLRKEIDALKGQLKSVPHEKNPDRPQSAVQQDAMVEIQKSIIENFQERMQLRRSLIELEDQNVQNSIEVGKRQLIIAQWSSEHGGTKTPAQVTRDKIVLEGRDEAGVNEMLQGAPQEVWTAWRDMEQLRKAIEKNNTTKKNIAKRLRNNERRAESMREDLATKITSEDRIQLMELQYRIGKLELENMELEQSKIVHNSIMKGKDLTIMKLRLQLQVRDKIIESQRKVLALHNLDTLVSYSRLALMEQEGVAISFDTIRNSGLSHQGSSGPPNNHAFSRANGLQPTAIQDTKGVGRLSPVFEKKPSFERKPSPIRVASREPSERSNHSDEERRPHTARRRRHRPHHSMTEDTTEASQTEEEGQPSGHWVPSTPQPSGDSDPSTKNPLQGNGLGIPVVPNPRPSLRKPRPSQPQQAAAMLALNNALRPIELLAAAPVGLGNRRRNFRGHTKVVEDPFRAQQISVKKLPYLKVAEEQGISKPISSSSTPVNDPEVDSSNPTIQNSPYMQANPYVQNNPYAQKPPVQKLGARKALGKLNQKNLLQKQHPQPLKTDHRPSLEEKSLQDSNDSSLGQHVNAHNAPRVHQAYPIFPEPESSFFDDNSS